MAVIFLCCFKGRIENISRQAYESGFGQGNEFWKLSQGKIG